MFNLTIKYLGANLRAKLNKITEQNKVKSAKFARDTYEIDPASRTKEVDYLSPSVLEKKIYEWKVEEKVQLINNPFEDDFRAC